MVIRKILNFVEIAKLAFTKPYFGFIQGHYYLSNDQIKRVKENVGKDNFESSKIISEFEDRFASIVGEGSCVSYGAGRMAFFSLMKAMNIGEGDEVIIQTTNCSVMVNAILRTGARPVYSDIDLNTYGSDASKIIDKITYRTKMIVAQHTFGIPCGIKKIAEIAKEKGIFLLEDCAITVSSAVNGIIVGNFGDASLFSTEHSKPINTIVGGLIYTKNNQLYEKLINARTLLSNFSLIHQRALFDQFVFEKKYFRPDKYGFGILMTYLKSIFMKIKLIKYFIPDLDDDYFVPSYNEKNKYPYPAKFPGFLAQIGLYELDRWNTTKQERRTLLLKYIDVMKESGLARYLPYAYFDESNFIIPLRFAFIHPDAIIIRNKMKKRFNIESFWFLTPIVACHNPMDFGYIKGTSLNSEKLSNEVINFPCSYDKTYALKLINFLRIVILN